MEQTNPAVPSIDERASEWYLLQRQRRLTPVESAALQSWLAEKPEHATAWRDTQATWECFGDHATLPELVVAREQALVSVRRAQVKRWARPESKAIWTARLAAAAAFVAIGGLAVWQLYPVMADSYSTHVGEQRTLLLPDNSSLAMDALTRVRIRYDSNKRVVELLEGQAQFDVAADPSRPFNVRVAGKTIEALGTSFTVTYFDERVRVALLDGRIKVTDGGRNNVLAPGQALRIDADGRRVLNERADLAAATAWRHGKVVLEHEPLKDAVERLNRYSRTRIEIADPAIRSWPVSGIFGVGDAEAFAEALSSYFPIQTQRSADGVIVLRARP